MIPITINATSTADLFSYVASLFTSLWPLIALAMGIPLAFYIIGKVISLVRGRTK